MKKLVTLFLTISALFALSARAQQIPYQDWYPAETLLLVSHDAEHSLGRDFPHFKKGISQFCDSLNDIMEYRLFSEFLTSSIEEYGVQKDFSAIVGQRATFGIFPLDPFAAKLPIALYISEVPNKEKVDAVLQSFFAAAKKGLPSLAIETDEYHGHVLKTLHGPGMIPGIGLSYTFQNSQLILSNNKPALVRMLDEHEFQENRLASNPIYQSVLKKLPQPRYLTFYINFNAITKTVTHVLDFFKSMEEDKKKKNGNSENIIHTWESTQSLLSLKGYGFAVHPSPNSEAIHLSGFLATKTGAKDNPFADMNREPIDFTFEKYLPRKTGSFMAGNVFSLKDIWALAQTVVTAFPHGEELIRPLVESDKQFGFSLQDDLLAWMTHEWCLVRPVMDLEAVIPMNRSAYLMRVKDRQQAEAGLQKVFRAMIEKLEWPLKLETLNHKDIPITSLTLPIPVPIRPSWCITDENLLLLATDTDLIREILEIQAGSRTGIERNYNYRQLRELLQTKGNMFTFQDVEEEFYTYREALRRVAAVLDQATGMDENIEQDDEAFKGMLLMDRASYLLRCLQIFKGSVKVSNTQEGGLFTNQRVQMKDLRTVPSLQSVIQYKISLLPPNEIAKIIDNLIQEDSPKEAIRYYRILVEFYPNNPDFLSRLAALYKKTGQAQDAVEAYNISLNIMPNTALLIEREKIRNADSAQTIMQHVKEEADKTRRIDRNMALFGIALHKRDTGQPDIAKALLQAVEPGSKVGGAAKQELFLLTGELPPVGMAVPLAEQNIEIDGHSKDTAWEKADAYPLFSSSSSKQDAWTARVKFLRDETYLHILLSGKDPVPIEQIKNQTFQILVDADRDYASLKTFHVEMKKHEEETVFIERINEDKVNIMDLVLKEKDRKKDKLGSYWRKEISCEGQYWQMEIALPLLELWDGAARKDRTLLLNILRNVKTENQGQNTQTLIQSTDPKDVFKYRCIKLAD